MIHTRDIIKRLSYDKLVQEGVIPDLVPVTEKQTTINASRRYPPFVYSNTDEEKYSFFGMLLDYIIRAGLRIYIEQIIELGNDPNMENILKEVSNTYETSKNIYDITTAAFDIVSTIYGKNIYNKADIQSYVPALTNIIKAIVAKWQSYDIFGTICFNKEYNYEIVTGHPDIITDECILDIKTTGSFPKMAKQSYLQVLAYCALMKLTTKSMRYIGFILPMQRDIILYDVENWDSSAYIQTLVNEADKITKRQTNILLQIAGCRDIILVQGSDIDIHSVTNQLSLLTQTIFPYSEYRIGSHMSKGKNIVTSLNNFIKKRPDSPCQMFLRNPRTGKQSAKTATQISLAAEIIKQCKLQYYTHAPYVINLCANEVDNGDFWQQRILNEDIVSTIAMGGKGVVVHTGARKDKSEDEAITIMEYMVRNALEFATEDCPLLLETPCREGTEVCSNIEDLGNFFYRFSSEERKKLGLCLDVAHVFVAGYDPVLYFEHWDTYCPVPIKLVHFNDAAAKCGACIDRHALPGQGYIGLEKMHMIAQYCTKRNIPMLCEGVNRPCIM